MFLRKHSSIAREKCLSQRKNNSIWCRSFFDRELYEGLRSEHILYECTCTYMYICIYIYIYTYKWGTFDRRRRRPADVLPAPVPRLSDGLVHMQHSWPSLKVMTASSCLPAPMPRPSYGLVRRQHSWLSLQATTASWRPPRSSAPPVLWLSTHALPLCRSSNFSVVFPFLFSSLQTFPLLFRSSFPFFFRSSFFECFFCFLFYVFSKA